MLITKPYLIFEILNHIRHCNNSNIKHEIAEKIQWVISRLHINSFILTQKSILKQHKYGYEIAFIEELVDILIINNRDNSFTDQMLNVLSYLVQYSGIKLGYFYKVFQILTFMFTNKEERYDCNKFLLILKILNCFTNKSVHDGKFFPEKFFFFNNRGSEIKVNVDDLQLKSISISKGYTIGMWVYLEKVNHDASNKYITDVATLFYISTNKYVVFEAIINKNSIYYKSYNISIEGNNNSNSGNSSSSNQGMYLTDIEYNKWTFLVFTHKPVSFLQKPAIVLYKNRKEPIIKQYDYPNLSNQKITSIYICKDFTGLVSNVFMLSESLNQPFIVSDLMNYNFGLYNEKNIRIFKDYLTKSGEPLNKVNNDIHNNNDSVITLSNSITNNNINTNILLSNSSPLSHDQSTRLSPSEKQLSEFKLFFDNLIFIYSPSRVKGKIIKDITDNLNGEISTYIDNNLTGGVCEDNSIDSSNTIFGSDSICIFLPIYEFIFNTKFGTALILEEAIALLINIYSRNDLYNCEFVKQRNEMFLDYLSMIMMKYDTVREFCIASGNDLFTKEILNKLIELGDVLLKHISTISFDVVKKYFIKIIFEPKIINFFESQLQIELWKKVENLYKNNMDNMIRIFNAKDIIDLIIKVYDNDINIYCCKTHMKMLIEQESNINNNNNNKRLIMFPELNERITHLINIARNILTNSNHVSINQMTQIISLLALEISPCLQKELIMIFYDVVHLEFEHATYSLITGYIKGFLKGNGIEHLMYVNSLSTLDIRYECLKLFNLLINYKQFPFEVNDEFVPFLCNSFFPIKTPLNHNVRLDIDNDNTNMNMNINTCLFSNDDINKVNIASGNNTTTHNDNDQQGQLMLSPHHSRSSSKNSLMLVEEEYWKLINSETLIKNLSLPVKYIQDYSNSINDSYVENIYNFLIQWLVNRYDITQGRLELDDSDEIAFEPALNLLMQLVMYSSMFLKQRFIADLYTLTQFNKANCYLLMQNKYFYQWLLDLILPYQIIKLSNTDNSSDKRNSFFENSGLCETILTLGIKFHTTVIINSILFEEEKQRGLRITRSFYGYDEKSKKYKDSFSIINIFEELLTWFYKMNKIGTCEGKASVYLLRTIFMNLITALKMQIEQMKLLKKQGTIWLSYQVLTLAVYEFVLMSNFNKDKNFDLIEKNEIINEVIQNLHYNYSSNQQQQQQQSQTPIIDLWEDKDLLLNLYECYKNIWQDSFFIVDKNNSNVLYDDETSSIKYLLDKKLFDETPNAYIYELKLLLYKTHPLPTNNNNTNTTYQNILKANMNIIMLIIRLSESKDDISTWVKELEKFLLYLIIISHKLCIDLTSSCGVKVNDQLLMETQDEIADVFVLSFNFLLDEINSPRRKEIYGNDIINEFISCLRTLFIAFSIVIEKVLTYVNEKNSQSKMQNVWNFIITVKNTITMQNQPSYLYSPLWKVYSQLYLNKSNETIFDLESINEFKLNNYIEIPRKFTCDEWLYAMQDNAEVTKIIKAHFNFEYYCNVIRKRFVDAEMIKVNQNVCYKEYKNVMKVYKNVSSVVKCSLDLVMNDIVDYIYQREMNVKDIEHKWKQEKKMMFTWRGKWIDVDDYLNVVHCKNGVKFKVANHYSWNGGYCPVLYNIYNIWEYLPKFEKYEPRKELFLDGGNSKEGDINDINNNNNQAQIVKNSYNPYIRLNYSFDENFNDNEDNKQSLSKIQEQHSIISCGNDDDSDNGINNNNNNNQSNSNSNIINTSIQLIKSNNKLLHLYNELKVKPFTNKAILFYTNSHFSDFIDIYSDLESIFKYYHKAFTSNYNKCIINLHLCFINNAHSNKKTEPVLRVFPNVCLLKNASHIKGSLILTSKHFHFILKYPLTTTTTDTTKCNGELFTYDLTKVHKLKHSFNITDITRIYKRRYFYKKLSMEVFTTDNKSYYLIFDTQVDRDDAYKIINVNMTMQQQSLDKIIKDWEQWEISNMDMLCMLNNYSGRSFKDLTQYPVFPWIISDYVSSSKELKKYKYDNIRDLTKPIGAIGNEERTQSYLQKFYERDSSSDIGMSLDNNEDINTNNNNNNNNNDTQNIITNNDNNNIMSHNYKYHYSSHYSNPFYVTHYLYRLFPYSSSAIELQGNGFDTPSRQFISIEQSYTNCMTEATDVRELIPEFYYLPEMFININNINFGDVPDIHGITLPKWSHNNPYKFTIKNRLALESDYVSAKINNWVDLIYGYKQKGKEAINAMNTFFKSSYEDAIDIDKYIKESKKDEYDSYISRIDFGQTPSQLFNSKPFISRLTRDKAKCALNVVSQIDNLRYYNSTSEKINSATYKTFNKDIARKMIIYIKAVKHDKVLCVFNNGISLLLKANDTPYSESGLIFINDKKLYMPSDYKECSASVNKQTQNVHANVHSKIMLLEEDEDIMKNIEQCQPVVAIKNGKYIIKGGYYDSKFLLYQCDNTHKNFIYIAIDKDSKVTSLLVDEKHERFLYVGTSTGKIFIYNIHIKDKAIPIHSVLTFNRIIFNHMNAVNMMYYNNKINIIASISNDKTCNVYTYPLFRMVTVIKHHNDSSIQFDYVFVSSNPLACVVLYSKSEMMFYVYSLNGKFIKQERNKYKVLFNPKVVCDSYQRDVLVFGTNDGCLVMRRLPLLDGGNVLELGGRDGTVNMPIKCFDFAEDGQTVYYWQLENFNLSVVKCKKKGDTEEDKKSKQFTLFDGELNI